MRGWFLVYGVLYVVIEMVGHQLDAVGWPRLTALDVATAVVNALLVVAVGIAVLVAVDVLGHRWRRRVRAWRLEQAHQAEARWLSPEPITVRAWRPGRLALTAGPASTPARGHSHPGTDPDGDRYLRPDFLDQHGRLL
jgi:hypothetical protein